MRCEMDHSHLLPLSKPPPKCYTAVAVGWGRRLEPHAPRTTSYTHTQWTVAAAATPQATGTGATAARHAPTLATQPRSGIKLAAIGPARALERQQPRSSARRATAHARCNAT